MLFKLGRYDDAIAAWTGATIGLWDIWTPRSGLDWLAITFFLLNLEANAAVLAASAAIPEPLEDEEE